MFIIFLISFVFVALNLSFSDSLVFGNNSVTSFEVSVARHIGGDGYHRLLNVLVTIYGANVNQFHKDCHLAIYQELPKGVYVDPEQLKELSESYKALNQYYLEDDKIDVEASKEKSDALNVVIFYNKLEQKLKDIVRTANDSVNTGKINYSFSLPIHIRYHAAIFGGGYQQINITYSSLLAKCPPFYDDAMYSILSPFRSKSCRKKFYVPCPADIHLLHQNFCPDWKPIMCDEYKVESQMVTNAVTVDVGVKQEELSMFVPVGNLDQFWFVQIVTLVFADSATVYVIYCIYSSISSH